MRNSPSSYRLFLQFRVVKHIFVESQDSTLPPGPRTGVCPQPCAEREGALVVVLHRREEERRKQGRVVVGQAGGGQGVTLTDDGGKKKYVKSQKLNSHQRVICLPQKRYTNK